MENCLQHSISIFNEKGEFEEVLYILKEIFSLSCAKKGYIYQTASGKLFHSNKYNVTLNPASEHLGNQHYDAHRLKSSGELCGGCGPNQRCCDCGAIIQNMDCLSTEKDCKCETCKRTGGCGNACDLGYCTNMGKGKCCWDSELSKYSCKFCENGYKSSTTKCFGHGSYECK